MSADQTAIEWLLRCDEPAVRMLAGRDVLGVAVADPTEVLDGAWVRALLAGQRDDGGFGGNPYLKWTGAHWRLVSLVELGVPQREPRAVRAADRVLAWLTGTAHRRAIHAIDGLVRRCASQEGNALAACSRLGLTEDPRVRRLAESLIEWQWPDGGWNCDPRASGRRSSFHESLPPMWGLHEFAAAGTGPLATSAAQAAARTAELFLGHRLFRALRNDDLLRPQWLKPRYPPYWHYDILQALLVLSRMHLSADLRAADVLDELERQRKPDGRWHAQGYWWRAPAGKTGPPDVVDWGRSGPNVMVTLNALRVLTTAGRLA